MVLLDAPVVAFGLVLWGSWASDGTCWDIMVRAWTDVRGSLVGLGYYGGISGMLSAFSCGFISSDAGKDQERTKDA